MYRFMLWPRFLLSTSALRYTTAAALMEWRCLCRHSQPAVKNKADPKAYNDQLKAELPAEAYEGVRKALKAFKEGRDSNALVDRVVDILKQPGRHHLLSGFSVFLPRNGCAHLRNCIRYSHTDVATAVYNSKALSMHPCVTVACGGPASACSSAATWDAVEQQAMTDEKLTAAPQAACAVTEHSRQQAGG